MAGERPFRQHVAVIAFEGAGNLEGAGALRRLQCPAVLARPRVAQHEAGMRPPGDLVARFRGAVAGDVTGRGREHARAVLDHPKLQGAVFEGAEVEGEIEPLGHQIDAAVGKAQAGVRRRIAILEIGDVRGDEAPPDAERRGDEDAAPRLLPGAGHLGLGLLDRLEDAACAPVEEMAVLRRFQHPCGAVEKPHAEVLFKLGDAARGNGGRTALIARRRRHGAKLVDAHEHAQRFHIGHGFAPFA